MLVGSIFPNIKLILVVAILDLEFIGAYPDARSYCSHLAELIEMVTLYRVFCVALEYENPIWPLRMTS